MNKTRLTQSQINTILFTFFIIINHFCLVKCSSQNAYEILGVSRSATQDEIRLKYRKLCLQYHPDKNVSKSDSERKKCEEIFKSIQEANTAIGDAESRTKYDNDLRRAAFQARNPYHTGNQYSGRSGSPYSSPLGESIFRSYYEQQRRQQFNKREAFYFNGVDISNLFPDPGKSVYVAQVSVPLSDLYNGKSQHTFILKESIWNRYRAAFRGGAARQIAIQGFLSSLAILLKSGWTLSLCFFGVYFHCQLPHLRRSDFSTRLKRGWKSGTKLKFENVEPGIDVILVLKEEKHDEYERLGNDLVTTIKLARNDLEKNKRKTGGGKCRIHLKLFDEREGKMEVLLSKEEVNRLEKTKTTEITVKGRGWPTKDGGCGDLKIRIDLKGNKKKKK